jgi:hypothetical protein
MPFGKAAVAIWCDVAPQARVEFDDWHAHEHMPERLSIPGFLRGSRWVSADGGSYFMLYEAKDEATITSGPYLERLNDPSAWSRKMMPQHRNMVRSLCRVVASEGAGLGGAMLTLRFPARPRFDIAGLGSRKGLVAARLLENIARPDAPQTTEQRIRGGDAAADWILLVTGYDAAGLAGLARDLPEGIGGLYALAQALT